jgi:non-ribosomal peptide synthetase-like protein
MIIEGLFVYPEIGGNMIEQQLCDVLAEVMDIEVVDAHSNFFDDLGADSLVMAHFCARLRKREDLPSVPIKAIYQHQTIESLAASLVLPADNGQELAQLHNNGAVPTPASNLQPVSPFQSGSAKPVANWSYFLCGAFQFATMLGYIALLGFIFAGGYDWATGATSTGGLYQRSMVFGMALFAFLAIMPILAKWLIVGRWKSEEFPIWGLKYFRFWLVKFLLGVNPLALFAGSPIYLMYLRALGAKIGKGVVVLSPRAPICADLLTIGDNAVVRKDSLFNCYRAEGDVIQTGRVQIGARAFVGELTVLDINTSLGDDAQLGHSSSLHSGQSIPAGEHRVGSPATQPTMVDYLIVAPVAGSRLRRTIYSLFQTLLLVTFTLPIGLMLPILIFRLIPTPEIPQAGEALPFNTWILYSEIALASIVLFFGLMLVGLVINFTMPRLLNLAIKPNVVYPLYGARYAAHRGISRFSNSKFFTRVFGDTSYIMHYLYVLGYDVSFDGQTGANFGTGVKHDNPFHVKIGSGTMAADGLSIINSGYSSTSFTVSPGLL